MVPGELDDVLRHQLPALAEIRGIEQLLVAIAGILRLRLAFRPGRGEDPIALHRVELEGIQLPLGTERAEGLPAVLGDPVHALSAEEDEEFLIRWSGLHACDLPNLLSFVNYTCADLLELVSEIGPCDPVVITAVQRPLGADHEDCLLFILATPLDIDELSVDLHRREFDDSRCFSF